MSSEERGAAEKAKHTPGPWKVEPDPRAGPGGVVLFDERKGRVLGHLDACTEERAANARLIAAAPDLLAACEAQQRTIAALVHLAECARADLAHLSGGGSAKYASEAIARLDARGARLPDHAGPEAIAKAVGK